MTKEQFYSVNNILNHNVINVKYSSDKTTAVLRYGLVDHINSGYENQIAIIRRWEEDFKGKNGQQMFENIVHLGWVEELTKGKYNSIYYWSQRWYLVKYDNMGEKVCQAEEPFALGFAITSEENYKSTSYPYVKTIWFDIEVGM